MGYALLWIESLAAALLLVAAATAYFAQARKRWLGRIVLCVAVAAPLIIGALETTGAAVLAYALIEHNWLAYTVSWLICLLAGSGLVLWFGLRRTEGLRAAASWPAAKLAVGCAVAVALHLITFWNMDTNVRLMLSSVRLEGGAMAVAAAPPRPPDQENAAFLYEKAFATIKQINEENARWKTIYGARSSEWYRGFNKRDYDTKDPELREFLKAHQATLTMLIRAAAMPGCYFERDYARLSLSTQLPELARLRECARLLAADARCKAAGGQVRAALGNVAAMQSIARHVGAEPILISYLVSVAIDELAMQALEGILTTTQPSAADLAALAADDTMSYQRILRRSLAGEEAFGLSAFSMFSFEAPTGALYQEMGIDGRCARFAASIFAPLWRVYMLPDDLEGYRNYMRQLRDIASLGFQEARSRMQQLEDEHKIKRAGILSGLMLPAVSKMRLTCARADAKHRLGILAVAIAAYRAKTGQFPAKLESLVPEYTLEVPLDPFDDKPLRLVPHPAGVTLYSIGEDLTDDGGTTEFNKETGKGDIVFRVGDVPSGK